ncbi:MAG: PDZ domain-containing protein [Pyrinomonadaceae bacterium]
MDLQRRGFLGVQVRAIPQVSKNSQSIGVEVVSVFDDSTASLLGVVPGDVLAMINGVPIRTPGDVGTLLASVKAGTKVVLEIVRKGEKKVLSNEMVPLPKEKFDEADVIHGSVKTAAGIQRSILTVPKNKIGPPVVYILQGFDCSSIEKPLVRADAYTRLITMLTRSGFATFRLEKSNVGDSVGMPCREIGFDIETKGFVDGLRHLVASPRIDGKNIYLLGISLGGIWAPILAEDVPVKGIISFGTIAKTWEEYLYENSRRQSLLAGRTYSSIERNLKLSSIFWHELFASGRTPKEILDAKTELRALAPDLTIDIAGGDYNHLFGRHYSFVKELNAVNIAEKWENVRSSTLLLYGVGDYIASESDQKLIESILLRKGTGVTLKYVNSDHYWRRSTSYVESYRNLRENRSPAFQEDILNEIQKWLEGQQTQSRSKGSHNVTILSSAKV